MGWISKFFGERDPQIITQPIVDPLKQNVASPLSEFLASNIGKGIPRYQGQLTSPLPAGAENVVSRYLALDPTQFFEERIKQPAMKTFKEELLPQVREEFAGSLSSSGRFRTEEEAASKFATGLAETQANLELQLPQSQFQMAQSFKAIQDADKMTLYKEWYSSLPQNNPALQSAISFLQDSTSSGTDILSGLDPGSEGWFGDFIMASMQLIGSLFGGGGSGLSGSIGDSAVT